MHCPWKFYIDIEGLFSAHTHLYTHFCTVDHVMANLNPIGNSIVMKMIEEKQLIGREIKNLGLESYPTFSKIVIEHHNMVFEQKKPLQFYYSHIIKNKHKIDLLIFKISIYSKTEKLESVFGIETCPWKFSIENAVKKDLTKKEVECLFLFLKKNVQLKKLQSYSIYKLEPWKLTLKKSKLSSDAILD